MKKSLLFLILAFASSSFAGPYDNGLIIGNQFNGDTTAVYSYITVPAVSGVGIFVHDPTLSNTGNGTGTLVFASVSSKLTYNSGTLTLDVDDTQIDYNHLLNKPAAAAARSFTTPTRSLNSAFQISTTRDTIVSYTVDIACTISLVTGQTGTVILEYADNSGMSTNVVTVASTANANTGTLTIGLNLTQTASASLSGVVPAGKYVRMRTVNTTGTPTFTYRTAQEVLL